MSDLENNYSDTLEELGLPPEDYMDSDSFHKLMLDRQLITERRKGNLYGTTLIRETFPAFLRSIGCRTGAEVGVHRGAYTRMFAEQLTGTFYAIDPWVCWPAYLCSGGLYRLKSNPGSLEKTENARKVAYNRLEKYNHVKILRQTSIQATLTIPDESLDMVYIDGNHKYPYVIIDLWGYWEKLRVGGIMSGHDLNFSTVNKAVNEFIAKTKIPYWYVMENERPTSFMWIK
jgi:hypothetical protein